MVHFKTKFYTLMYVNQWPNDTLLCGTSIYLISALAELCFNVTKTISEEQSSIHDFLSLVTSTVDRKLKNKDENARAICICKVGNKKLYALIGLVIFSLVSIIVFATNVIINQTINTQ